MKLNYRKNGEIDLQLIEEIQAPFKKLYLNNTAGTGTLKLLLGSKGMFYARKTTSRELRELQNFKLTEIDLTDDTQVNAAASINMTLQPSAGKIYQIIHIEMDIPDPVGSAAGTHYIVADIGEIATRRHKISLTSNFGTAIQIGYVSMFAATSESPSAEIEQRNLVTNGVIMCSNSIPLIFRYTNNTDVNQTGTRTLKIIAKELYEAI